MTSSASSPSLFQYNNHRRQHCDDNATTSTSVPMNKGFCVTCGIKTHRICPLGRYDKPLTNDEVLHGKCRRCDLSLAVSSPAEENQSSDAVPIFMSIPSTSTELFRSWSLRTIDAYLNTMTETNAMEEKEKYGDTDEPLNAYHNLTNHETDCARARAESCYRSGAATQSTSPLTSSPTSLVMSKQEQLFMDEIQELLREELDTDIIFRIGEQNIRAHKCIIDARCKGLASEIVSMENGMNVTTTSRTMTMTMTMATGEETMELKGTAGTTTHATQSSSSSSLDGNLVKLVDFSHHSQFVENPSLLNSAIELCYGGLGEHNEDRESTVREQQAQLWKLGYDFIPDVHVKAICKDFSTLLSANTDKEKNVNPFNVKIIGRNDMTGQDEWEIHAHSAILSAHSMYARSLWTHGWKVRTSSYDRGRMRLLILDSNCFCLPVITELLHACYANTLSCLDHSVWFSSERPTFDFFLRLYDASLFLSMPSISMLIADALLVRFGEAHLQDIYDCAETLQSTQLMESWTNYVTTEPSCLEGTRIYCWNPQQLEMWLTSNKVEMSEEKILSTLLIWLQHAGDDIGHRSNRRKRREESEGGEEQQEEEAKEEDGQHFCIELVKGLIQKYVRLPLVPVGSSAMKEAIRIGLVSHTDSELYYRFQTDHNFRMMKIEKNCTTRLPSSTNSYAMYCNGMKHSGSCSAATTNIDNTNNHYQPRRNEWNYNQLLKRKNEIQYHERKENS